MTSRPRPRGCGTLWRRAHPFRRAAVLLLVIMTMFIAGLLAVSMARLAVARHGQQQLQWRHQQAVLLAAAGVDRAAAELSRRPDYPGETWHIPAAELDGTEAAEVVIRCDAVADNPERRSVKVLATWGTELQSVRASQELELDLGKLSRRR